MQDVLEKYRQELLNLAAGMQGRDPSKDFDILAEDAKRVTEVARSIENLALQHDPRHPMRLMGTKWVVTSDSQRLPVGVTLTIVYLRVDSDLDYGAIHVRPEDGACAGQNLIFKFDRRQDFSADVLTLTARAEYVQLRKLEPSA